MTPALAEWPFVSVIVPTHRRRPLLARLLDSLLAQDWPADRYEIIVVHNFTPDGTDALVADVAARSTAEVRYFRTAFTRPGPSRQFGSEQARGEVLAFIDDDCQAMPGWIAAGVSAIRQGFALVQGRTLPDPAQPRRLLEKTISITGPTSYFETCNIFYLTHAFRAVGGFPAPFQARRSGEDTSLGWALLKSGYATGFAEDALVYHEVFAVTYRQWLWEGTVVEQMPFLVKEFPEMRRGLFLGVFLSRLTAAFDLFVIGAVGVVLGYPILLALGLPYVVLRFTDRGRLRAPHILVARLLFAMPRAAVMAWSLAVNSVRARCIVL